MRTRLLALILWMPLAASAAPTPDVRLVTVTGEAEVKVVPDEVVITLGVESFDPSLSAARKQNDESMRKVLALARRFDIEPKNIQTDYIQVEPRYDERFDEKNRRPVRHWVGYYVRKTAVVRLRDTSKFESFLSAALDQGANHVHGVQFSTTQLRKHRDEARILAVRAAREKAELLAKELGRKVQRPYTIQEGHSGWWFPYNAGGWGRGARMMAQNVMQSEAAGGGTEPGPTVSLGQISVTANVTIAFEFE